MLHKRMHTKAGTKGEPRLQGTSPSGRLSDGGSASKVQLNNNFDSSDHGNATANGAPNCLTHLLPDNALDDSIELNTYTRSQAGAISRMAPARRPHVNHRLHASDRGSEKSAVIVNTADIVNAATRSLDATTGKSDMETHGWVTVYSDRSSTSNDVYGGGAFQLADSGPSNMLHEDTVAVGSRHSGHLCLRAPNTADIHLGGAAAAVLGRLHPGAALEGLTDPEVLAMISRKRPDLRSAAMSVLHTMAKARAGASGADAVLGFERDPQHAARRASSRSVFSRVYSVGSHAGEYHLNCTSGGSSEGSDGSGDRIKSHGGHLGQAEAETLPWAGCQCEADESSSAYEIVVGERRMYSKSGHGGTPYKDRTVLQENRSVEHEAKAPQTGVQSTGCGNIAKMCGLPRLFRLRRPRAH
eukprot:jgi/Ulvmu1/3406/UM016_0023.1